MKEGSRKTENGKGEHWNIKTNQCSVYYDKKHRVQESDIKKGDTAICLQPKKNKLTPRFNPEQLTVTIRKHNMVTAEAVTMSPISRKLTGMIATMNMVINKHNQSSKKT